MEQSEWTARRKEIHETLHPETKQGAQGGGKQGKGTKVRAENDNVSFSVDTAAKTGQSRRTVERKAKIGTDLVPEARDALRDTATADNQQDLLMIAGLPADEQIAVPEAIRGRRGAIFT